MLFLELILHKVEAILNLQPIFLKTLVENNQSIDFNSFKWRCINFSWKNVDVDGRRNPASIPIVGDQIRTIYCRPTLDNILSWQ